MAKNKIVTYEYEDDLTGEKLGEGEAETIYFTYGGKAYEIDLSKANAKKLDDFMAPYIDAARKDSRGTVSGKPTRSAAKASTIREWGNQNGYPSTKGPLKRDLIDAYNAAFGNPS